MSAARTAASAAVLAGPIDGAGVIHGCYYPGTASGSHRVVVLGCPPALWFSDSRHTSRRSTH